jgi:uncharacterized membrane protein
MGHADLRRAVAASLACAALALVLPLGVLRLAFALPLVFFLPGYAIVAATFARRPLEPLKQLLLSAGLSLSTLAIGAVALNYFPGGIGSASWALLLVAVTIGACRLAAVRRPRSGPSPTAWSRPKLSPVEAGLIAAGALAAIVALVLPFVTVSSTHAVGYTEMWIQPASEPGASAVRIGVGNREHAGATYRLRVRFGGEDGEIVSRRVALESGEARILKVTGGAAPAERPLPVVAALFRSDIPGRAYRRVSTWIPATEEPG